MWHSTAWKLQISNNYGLIVLEDCAGRYCAFNTIYSLYYGIANFTTEKLVYLWEHQFLVMYITLSKNKYILLLKEYNNICNHTQLTALWMRIVWQLVLTSSIGHHQLYKKMNVYRRVRCVSLKTLLHIWVLHQWGCFI